MNSIDVTRKVFTGEGNIIIIIMFVHNEIVYLEILLNKGKIILIQF